MKIKLPINALNAFAQLFDKKPNKTRECLNYLMINLDTRDLVYSTGTVLARMLLPHQSLDEADASFSGNLYIPLSSVQTILSHAKDPIKRYKKSLSDMAWVSFDLTKDAGHEATAKVTIDGVETAVLITVKTDGAFSYPNYEAVLQTSSGSSDPITEPALLDIQLVRKLYDFAEAMGSIQAPVLVSHNKNALVIYTLANCEKREVAIAIGSMKESNPPAGFCYPLTYNQ